MIFITILSNPFYSNNRASLRGYYFIFKKFRISVDNGFQYGIIVSSKDKKEDKKMTLKELFYHLQQHNKFQEDFNQPTHAFKVYLNDYDSKIAMTYVDLMRYVRKEYSKQFVEQVKDIELQNLSEFYYARFIANGVGCSIQIYIA